MLLDGRTITRNAMLDADVCVIGAGAAGITLARELIGHPVRVCVIESGGLELDAATQALAGGEVIGLPYFDLRVTRLRYLGGTTNHWNGWCRPLDALDFSVRPWVPHSGWPFDRAHMDPFYERAAPIVQIGPYSHVPEQWDLRARPPLALSDDKVITRLIQFSPPTRFGIVYRSQLQAAENVRVLLNSNVLQLHTDPSGNTITHVDVGCLDGNRYGVRAGTFVVAAGGMENARLLLLSHDVQQRGLGNQHDLVGRFFGNHLYLDSGALIVTRDDASMKLYEQRSETRPSGAVSGPGFRVVGHLAMSERVQQSDKLLNYSVKLRPTDWSGLISGPAIKPADEVQDESWTAAVKSAVRNLDGVLGAAYQKVKAALSDDEVDRLYVMTNIVEQAPNPSSRVALGPNRDAFALPLLQLDWRLTDLDVHTVRRSQEIIGSVFGEAGLGRVLTALQPEERSLPPHLRGDFHHMGTTRMHADPKHGVVDAHCRVHGIANLFMAGSSVFPTVGYADPTLTIVALSLRLADHLKGLLR